MIIMKRRRNSILGDDYDGFVQSIYEMSEQDDLPATFHIEDIRNLSLDSVVDLMRQFSKDTCFKMEASLYICNDCGMPHVDLEVFNPEYDDTGYPLQ